jgi:hypothetical protein
LPVLQIAWTMSAARARSWPGRGERQRVAARGVAAAARGGDHRAELGVVALASRDRAVDQLARHLVRASPLGRRGVELGHRIRQLHAGRA